MRSTTPITNALPSSRRSLQAWFPDGWTLYDLRPLRVHFSQTGIADAGYERLVFGYDFLLLVPRTTADPAIDPNAF